MIGIASGCIAEDVENLEGSVDALKGGYVGAELLPHAYCRKRMTNKRNRDFYQLWRSRHNPSTINVKIMPTIWLKGRPGSPPASGARTSGQAQGEIPPPIHSRRLRTEAAHHQRIAESPRRVSPLHRLGTLPA